MVRIVAVLFISLIIFLAIAWSSSSIEYTITDAKVRVNIGYSAKSFTNNYLSVKLIFAALWLLGIGSILLHAKILLDLKY